MTIRSKAKYFLKAKLNPEKFNIIRQFYIKNVAFVFNTNESKIIDRYTQQLLQTYSYNVIDGPFKGLKYINESIGSSFFHKLAGYYEAVLIPNIIEVKNINSSSFFCPKIAYEHCICVDFFSYFLNRSAVCAIFELIIFGIIFFHFLNKNQIRGFCIA